MACQNNFWLRPPSLPPSLPPYLVGAETVNLPVGKDGDQLLEGRELQLHELGQPDALVVAVHHHVELGGGGEGGTEEEV